jgi:UDP-glucose 4-epimerase
MEKNAIIFGSSGFIGSALSKRFAQEGYTVYGCDLENNGFFKPHYFYPHTELENEPSNIFQTHFSLCINAAGSASVPYSFQEPFKDYELNTRIVFKILNELRKSGSKARFINLSSAAVYGNPKRLPIGENDTLSPISPYGNHKLMSEMIVEQFREHFQIEAISLRIFSAYGPGLKKQIFWDLYQKALKSNDFEVHGTGQESRDFIYIDDLVEAIFLIAETKDYLYPVYNIGNGIEITTEQIVSFFCKLYSDNLKYSFNGIVREGDPNNWCADIEKLKKLGYKPSFTIEKGIEQFVKWVKAEK